MSRRIGVAALGALALSACGAAPPVATATPPPVVVCLPGDPEPVGWADGARIVYSAVTGEQMQDVRIMRIDPGGVVLEDRPLAQGVQSPSLSPDPGPTGSGSMLLFTRKTVSGSPLYEYYLLEVDHPERGERNAGSAGSAAWSPDGRWIAFGSHPAFNGPLTRFDVTTRAEPGPGETVTLTATKPDGPTWDSYPVWSPDGRRIAFASNRDGRLSIYVVAADGTGGETRVDAGLFPTCRPSSDADGNIPQAWTADGRSIFAVRTCGGAPTTWLSSLSGDELGSWRQMPGWPMLSDLSPGGRQVLYSTFGPGGHRLVNIADVDGSHSRLLRPDAWSARWSPDPAGPGEAGSPGTGGGRIAFSGLDAEGRTGLFVINVDGSGEVQLTHDPAECKQREK